MPTRPSPLAALVLLVLAAAPAASQTPPLPAPTGTFKVGRLAHHVKAAAEADATSTSELMLYAWYPADAAARGRPTPYLAGWPQSQAALRPHAERMFRDA